MLGARLLDWHSMHDSRGKFCCVRSARRLREAMSAWGASAAQDMMRWKGGLPGTMMLTM